MSSLKKQKLLQINSLKAIHRGVEANVEATLNLALKHRASAQPTFSRWGVATDGWHKPSIDLVLHRR